MSPSSPLKSCVLQTMQMLLAEKTGRVDSAPEELAVCLLEDTMLDLRYHIFKILCHRCFKSISVKAEVLNEQFSQLHYLYQINAPYQQKTKYVVI